MVTSPETTKNLKFLLQAKDKKQAMLDLAGENKIDEELIDFIEINAVGALDAKNKQVYDFMQKLKGECLKFITKVPEKDSGLGNY